MRADPKKSNNKCMFKRILYLISQSSLIDSLIRVNQLFFISKKDQELMRLQNNFVFRHACMTPLTILSCTLDNLGTDLKKSSKKENIRNAKKAIKHLSSLITYVTKSEQKEESFDVNKSINEVIFLFKNKNNCAIFYSNFLPKKLKLFGSKLHFQEIIICLLNNAYEAYQDKKLTHISFSARIIKEQVFIGVVDFAKGMTVLAKKLALIKGVSYKEDGLGLGLSFTKQVVENEFKGVFKIISGYGVGTHVQVAIPIPKPCSQNPLQS